MVTTFPATEVRAPEKSDPTKQPRTLQFPRLRLLQRLRLRLHWEK